MLNSVAAEHAPVATEANPYVGPRPIKDTEKIYGRDRESTELLNLLIAQRIVLLHSPSGAGKSSLLQAALLPRLREKRFTVLPVMRVSGKAHEMATPGITPNRYVLNALLCLEETLPAGERMDIARLGTLTLDAYLTQRAAAEPLAETSGRPAKARYEVLIFDQFEEILTQDPTDQKAKTEFFAQLGAALEDRRRWALFVVREDYLGALEPYTGAVPTRLGNLYRLDLLRHDAARKAILGPALEQGVTFSSLISPAEIQDAGALAARLRDASDAVASHLKSQFSDDLRGQLAAYSGQGAPASHLPQTLVVELNRVLQGPPLYDEARFEKVTLRDSTRKLLSTARSDENLVRLNRQLLEDAFPRELAGAAVDRLLDDLRTVQVQGLDGSMTRELGPYVEPVQLQVVCYRLWQKWRQEKPGARVIAREDIGDVSNVDDALGDYYAETVQKAAQENMVAERAIREWFHNELITAQGIRSQVTKAPNDTRTHVHDDAERAALDQLVDSHLVRAEKRRGLTWYELAHDRLVEPVRANNTLWFDDHLSNSQRQAILWETQGREHHLLLREREWKEARDWAAKNPQDVTPVEASFIAASRGQVAAKRRSRLLLAGFVCCLLAFAGKQFYDQGRLKDAFAAQEKAFAAQSAAQRDLKTAFDRQKELRKSERRAFAAQTAAQLKARNALTAQAAAQLREKATQKNLELAKVWAAEKQRLAALRQLATEKSAKARLLALQLKALSRQLAAQSEVERPKALDLALLLGIEATRFSHQATNAQLLIGGSATRSTASDDFGPRSALLAGVSYTPQMRTFLEPRGNDIKALAVSPHGHYVALTDSYDLFLYDVMASPARLVFWQQVRVGTGDLMFSPNEKCLVGCDDGGKLMLWDTATGRQMGTKDLVGRTGAIDTIAFAPNGQLLALIAWDVKRPELKRFAIGNGGGFHELAAGKFVIPGWQYHGSLDALNADGSRLASIMDTAEGIVVWDTATGRSMERSFESGIFVSKMAFIGRGPVLAMHVTLRTGSATGVSEVRLWDTREPKGDLRVVPNWESLAFSSEGYFMVTGHDNRVRVRLNDPRGGFQGASNVDLKGHYGKVSAVALSSDGSTVVSADEAGPVIVWDMSGTRSFGRRLVLPMPLQDRAAGQAPSAALHVVFATDGKTLRSCDRLGRVIAWNVAQPAAARMEAQKPAMDIEAPQCSADGRWRVYKKFDEGAHIELTSAIKGRKPRRIESVNYTMSPRGALLAYANENVIFLRDCETGKTQKLDKHNRPVDQLAFSSNGKWLVSSDYEREVRLWNVANGQLVATCIAFQDITALAVQRDGKAVAFGNDSSAIYLWRPNSGAAQSAQKVTPFVRTHGTEAATQMDVVRSLDFNGDSTMLASGADSGTIILWDVATRQAMATPMAGHLPYSSKVIFSPDGRTLASAGQDGVRLWDTNVEAWSKRAGAIANRNLTQDEWKHYIGADQPYHRTIANLPAGK